MLTRVAAPALITLSLLILSPFSGQAFRNNLAFWRAPTASPFTWTGAGGNANWNTPGNWSGGSAPGASDTAIFVQSACGSTCNATINVNISIAGLHMTATYLGTISQGTSQVTIGSAHWVQQNGTFAGGSGSITLNGNLSLLGGTFTSTSGTLAVNASFLVSGAPTFNNNWGTVSFMPITSSELIQTGTITLNTVNFPSIGQSYTLTGSQISVLGMLTIGDILLDGSTMNGGVINAKSEVVFNNYGYRGTTLIKINGSGNQTVTGGSASSIPAFEVASTGGTVTLGGTLKLTNDYTYTAGSISAYTIGSSSGYALAQGPDVLYLFDETSGAVAADSSGNNNAGTLAGGITLGQAGHEGGDFQLSSTGVVTLGTGVPLGANSTISAWVKTPLPNDGNWKTVTRGSSDHHMIFDSATNEFGAYLNYNSSAFHGSGVFANSLAAGWHHFAVVMTGSNTLFYVDGTYVSTTGGQSTDTVEVIGNYQGGGQGVPDLDNVAIFTRALSPAEITIQANPPAGTSSTLVFANNAGSPTVTPGNSVNYDNVSFTGANSNYTVSGTMKVANNLIVGDTTTAGKTLTGGTISTAGNVNFQNYGYGGSTLIDIVGRSQSITGAATALIPKLRLAASGAIGLFGTLNVANDYTYVSGAMSSGTSLLNFKFPASGSYGVTPGAVTYHNVGFLNGGSTSATSLSGTLTANGTLTFASVGSPSPIDGGAFVTTGNVNFSSYGATGTSTLSMTGASSSSLTVAGTAAMLGGSVTVNKSAASTLTLNSATSLATSGQTLTVTSGIVDLAGYNLSVNSLLTVGSSGSVFCNGGVLTSGSLTNNGIISCPGIGFEWTGASGDNNWNTAGNWSGGAVPGAGNTATFTGGMCSGANCNATINANVSLAGVRLYAGYSGTITQATGRSVALGSAGWVQEGGTFVGGDTFFGSKFLKLTGGAFTAPAANLMVGYNVFDGSDILAFDYSGGTFNHNGGTVEVYANRPSCYTASGTFRTINTTGTLNFNNVVLTADWDLCYNADPSFVSTGAGTINVLGNLTHDGGVYSIANVNLAGNFTYTNRAHIRNNSTGSITLNGTGAQTYTGTAGGIGPKLVISKASGGVTTASTNINLSALDIQQGSITAPSGQLRLGLNQNSGVTWNIINKAAAGTFNHNNGSVLMSGAFATCSYAAAETITTSGALTFNNVELYSIQDACYGGITYFSVISGTAYVEGNFTFNGGVMDGNWNVAGNLLVNNGASYGGNAPLTFYGATNSTVTVTAGSLPGGAVTVNKVPGLSLTLGSNVSFNAASQDLSITSGTLNMAGYNLTVNRDITNSGILQRGASPGGGTLSFGGTYTGTAPVCP